MGHRSAHTKCRYESAPTQSAERVARRERYQNSHRATTRAIWHAQSAERVARAHVRSHKTFAHTTKNEHWKRQTLFSLGFGHFLTEVYKALRLPQKLNRRHQKCCTCHMESSSFSNQKWRQFHKKELSTLSKRRPSSSNNATAMQNLFLFTTPANVPKVPRLPRVPRGWKSVRCPAPVTQNDVLDLKMSRKCHVCHEKLT